MAKLSEEEETFLKMLPADGSAIVNRALQTALGWDEERYFKVRASLKEKGEVALGVGRGGRVMRVVAAEKEGAEVEEVAREVAEERQREVDLYDDFKAAVEKWAKWEDLPENRIVQITASQGRRATGGQWTRPDLALLSVAQYLYVPGKTLDVVTFEVKTKSNWNITSVFEAAAHSRFATKSYLAIEVAEGGSKDPDLERIEEECARFGIGLAYFRPKQQDFEVYLDPRRNQPDPADVDRFISEQIDKEYQEKLVRWLR